MKNYQVDQWRRESHDELRLFDPLADDAELYTTIRRDIEALPEVIRQKASRSAPLSSKWRKAYLTRVMGEVQALRVFLEDADPLELADANGQLPLFVDNAPTHADALTEG